MKNTDQLIDKIIGLMMIDPKLGWLVLICIHSRSSENHSKATQFNPLAHCHIKHLFSISTVALPPPHPPPKNNREHTHFFALKIWEAGFMLQNHNGQDLPPAFWGLGEDQQHLCGTLDLDDACHHKIIPTAHCFFTFALPLAWLLFIIQECFCEKH